MLVMGQQRGRIRKMALQGDPFTPNAYLRVLPPDGTRPARLVGRSFGVIEPTQEIFLQRSGYPHPGSPQAPVAYKCRDGLPPTELVDFAGMPVVYWAEVLNGSRTVNSLLTVFIALVEGEE